MNTIIVPTDFSPASENAMHYGAQLAQQLNASVILVHVYQLPVSMNDMPLVVVSADELKKSSDIGLERCRSELQKRFPSLAIQTESRLGSVTEELNSLTREKNSLAVVMGSHNIKGLERIVFGSTTASVIRHVHCPVFAIPEGFNRFPINNIVLAADLEDVPESLANKIIEIARQLNAKLHIVHVTTREEAQRPDTLLQKLNTLSPSYQTVSNKKVKQGLQNYVREASADLLILLPHEHNLTDRLFFKVHTGDIIADTKIPVLAIKG